MSKYSKEFKQKVVDAYLAGEGGYKLLAKRFEISSYSSVRKWVIAFKLSGGKGLASKKLIQVILFNLS